MENKFYSDGKNLDRKFCWVSWKFNKKLNKNVVYLNNFSFVLNSTSWIFSTVEEICGSCRMFPYNLKCKIQGFRALIKFKNLPTKTPIKIHKLNFLKTFTNFNFKTFQIFPVYNDENFANFNSFYATIIMKKFSNLYFILWEVDFFFG